MRCLNLTKNHSLFRYVSAIASTRQEAFYACFRVVGGVLFAIRWVVGDRSLR
ncbi:MAG: hypothetical protein ACR2LR_03900 [Hassallia sp.]